MTAQVLPSPRMVSASSRVQTRAGKSTLFKLIAGMIRADQGVVQVGGVTPDVFGEDIFPQEIFYLPQEDADFALSPRDFYAMIYGEEFADVIRLTRSFGLGDQQLNETKISELSGGEREESFSFPCSCCESEDFASGRANQFP